MGDIEQSNHHLVDDMANQQALLESNKTFTNRLLRIYRGAGGACTAAALTLVTAMPVGAQGDYRQSSDERFIEENYRIESECVDEVPYLNTTAQVTRDAEIILQIATDEFQRNAYSRWQPAYNVVITYIPWNDYIHTGPPRGNVPIKSTINARQIARFEESGNTATGEYISVDYPCSDGEPTPEPQPPLDEFLRVSGRDRIETARRFAEIMPETSTAMVASSGNWPDALSGGAVAGMNGWPLLLAGNTLPEATRQYLESRQGSLSQIVIVGGNAAVSAETEAQLRQYANVVRIAGPTRYETSARISQESFPEGASSVFIATGENFADALAGVPVAAREESPILLTAGNRVPTALATELGRLRNQGKLEQVVILGGIGAVSEQVADTIHQLTGIRPRRVAGENRFATAVAIAEYERQRTGVTRGTAVIATGENFADALAAGPYAAGAEPTGSETEKAVMLLTQQDRLASQVEAYLRANQALTRKIVVAGGTAAVSDTVAQQALNASSGR